MLGFLKFLAAIPEIFSWIKKLYLAWGDAKNEHKAEKAIEVIDENAKDMLDGGRPKWD